MFSTAEEALKFYGESRTSDGEGVTIPSQRRYTGYYARMLRDGPKPCITLEVRKVRLCGIPIGGCRPFFKASNGQTQFKSKEDDGHADIPGDGLRVSGDVKIVFFTKSALSKEKLFHFWFHTSFIEGSKLVLAKEELDGGPAKDKKNAKFPRDFRVEVDFAAVPSATCCHIHPPGSGVTGAVIARYDGTDDTNRVLRVESSVGRSIESVREIRRGSVGVGAAATGGADGEEEEPVVAVAQAIYDYSADEDSHLSIRRNDVINVTRRDQSGWWRGECQGHVGWFPHRYVVVLSEVNVEQKPSASEDIAMA